MQAHIRKVFAAMVTALVCLLLLPGITARADTTGADPTPDARQEILKDKADLQNQPWTGGGSSEFEIIIWPEKNEITVKVKIVYEDARGAQHPVPGIQVALSDILSNGKSAMPFDGTTLVTGDDGTVAFVLKDYPKDYRIHLSREGTYLGSHERYFYEDGQIEVIVLYRESPVPSQAPGTSLEPAASQAPATSSVPAGIPENRIEPETGTSGSGDSHVNRIEQGTPAVTKAPADRPAVTLSPTPEPSPEVPVTNRPTHPFTWPNSRSICPLFHFVELLLMLLLVIYTAIRLHRIRRYMEWLDGGNNGNDGNGGKDMASAGWNGQRLERCCCIRRRQRMAVAVHVLFILAYIIMGVLLVVLTGHCRLDVPLYVIYTVEILVCSTLLYRAERKLRKQLEISQGLSEGDRPDTISTDREEKE